MTYKLFIDDERHPITDDWVIARSSAEAIKIIEERGHPQEIAFDHDLGDGDTVTSVFLPWYQEALLDGKVKMPELFLFTVHSANPVGRARIAGWVEGLIQECLGVNAYRTPNPDRYVHTMKCKDCGHEQKATPARVDYEAGHLVMSCGSKFNFCDKCDGPMEVVAVTDESVR